MLKFRDPHCSFCKSEIADACFAEDGDFLAVYNISPILPGHALIIPRYHVPSLLDLSDDEVAKMVLFSRSVVRNLTRIFSSSGFNWTIQEGASAGQTVLHLHLHLIPRAEGDLPQPGDWYPRLLKHEAKHIDSEERPRLTPEEMSQVVSHILRNWDPG